MIVTQRGAVASDVRALIERMRAGVAQQFGIELELEIVLMGEGGGTVCEGSGSHGRPIG
jgi:UDP-N-acetylenolpyruvoylglucosamine reductase